MSALDRSSGFGVTGFEYVENFLLVVGAHELVPVALMPVVEFFFVFGTGCYDAAVSNKVLIFLSATG